MKNTLYNYDAIIIGAGAAGLICAVEAAKIGKKILILDHSVKVAEKIRISGGGRCNFTNIYTASDKFLSQNPHFCKSALKRYTPQHFIERIEKYNIAYHEKKLGQLFCDYSAQDIIDMFLQECEDYAVTLKTQTIINKINKLDDLYQVESSKGEFKAKNLVIATGGLSIPKIGATPFGYNIAKQFDLNIVPTRAALVPLTFNNDILDYCKNLSGIAVEASVQCDKTSFAEGMLFTHRGLSGPSILQISSYWREGKEITINLIDGVNIFEFLKEKKQLHAKQDIQTILNDIMPKRLAQSLCEYYFFSRKIADMSHKKLEELAKLMQSWTVKPNGTEGYRTAEVTLGGVDTNELSSQTMESKKHKGLYFIGEVVDVTGHLGGYNFQWAWSSGYVAAQSL